MVIHQQENEKELQALLSLTNPSKAWYSLFYLAIRDMLLSNFCYLTFSC